MNSEELKSIIENARISKGISQRELSKLSDISRSTLNDLINGKIKKVDVDALKKLAETLDLSLEKLLKLAGYNEFLRYFTNDRFKTKSTTDLKKLIEAYKRSQLDILDFDYQKRKKALELMKKIDNMNLQFKLINENSITDYTLEQAITDMNDMREALKEIAEKYDYDKLPKHD